MKVRSYARKHLLYVSYYLPPTRAIASVRSFNWCKQFAALGWDVDVLTPAPDLIRGDCQTLGRENIIPEFRVLPSGHNLKALAAGIVGRRELFGRPHWRALRWITRKMGIEPEIGWRRPALRAATSLNRLGLDVVVATGGPFVAFDVGARIARRACCPLILDYRDLWTGSPHPAHHVGMRAARLERRLLQQADGITAVSPSMAEVLRGVGGSGARYSVVTNGYDREEMSGVVPTIFKGPAVVYAGEFYPPKRTIEPLMKALALLNTTSPEEPRWTFHYFGSNKGHVTRLAEEYGLSERTTLHGRVERAEALKAIAGASVAVVIATQEETGSVSERGILTGKLFEAIGLGTFVVFIGPIGSDAETILSTADRGVVVQGTQTEALAKVLRRRLMRGRERMEMPPEYSWSSIGREAEAFVRSVMEERRRAIAERVTK